MTDEISSYEKTINECKRAIDNELQDVATLDDDARIQAVQRMEQTYKQLHKALVSIRYPIRAINNNPVLRAEMDKALREHTNDATYYDSQIQQLKQHRSNNNTAAVVGCSSDGIAINLVSTEGGEQRATTTQVLRECGRIQDKSIAALERTQRMGLETEEIGRVIITKTREQTEGLDRIGEQITVLEEEVRRAQRDLIFFVRSAMGDKCFMCMLALVVIAVVFIVCYKIFGKK
jgi:hypothetical protein